MNSKQKNIFLLEEHQPFVNPNGWGNGRDYSDKMGYLIGIDLKFTEPNFPEEPKYLGIFNWTASYYIGASWFVKNESTVIVTPKMKNIDFVTMFLAALEVDTKKESDYFARCYGIQFDEPTIETNEQLNQLTPLLVLHFISLLDRLVKRGLKKDYIIREENLKTKVKGRILFTKHLQKNVFQQRSDRVYCQFQEYTEDIPENRLLKKALLFADRIINNYESLKAQLSDSNIQSRLSKLKNRFGGISDEIEPYQVQKLSTNKLFKEYKDAIRVAKMLLRRYDYSISEASQEQHSTPPFWIDMSRLYEMWVFSQLEKAYPGQIRFQVKGHCGTMVDFIKKDECLIMDAKYKPRYEYSNKGIIDDIREISGYARDRKIIHELPIAKDYSEEIKCVIIYPEPVVFQNDKTLLDEERRDISHDICKDVTIFDRKLIDLCSEIKWFRNFYKISIKLPITDT
ncbi:MAG: McrC family protein [Bacteroidales bacterium]|nr:McrC family protein [Bacteroidales bacterium]